MFFGAADQSALVDFNPNRELLTLSARRGDRTYLPERKDAGLSVERSPARRLMWPMVPQTLNEPGRARWALKVVWPDLCLP